MMPPSALLGELAKRAPKPRSTEEEEEEGIAIASRSSATARSSARSSVNDGGADARQEPGGAATRPAGAGADQLGVGAPPPGASSAKPSPMAHPMAMGGLMGELAARQSQRRRGDASD